MCKLAGRDKATTYRHLQALEDAGFVEQNPTTKLYRLGPAVLQLAQTREVTVPRKAGAEAALMELAEATGETSHVSVLSGTTVYALTSCESPRHSTRAIIDIQTFPLHATASGLVRTGLWPSGVDRCGTGKSGLIHRKHGPRRTLQNIIETSAQQGSRAPTGSLKSTFKAGRAAF